MTNKSIGQFIAALRKANGLTQQEVADRLNVSNKSVSRWERGECAPDLSLIPALAEMFNVTCDELLKGERIIKNETIEKSGPKIEKQLKALVNRAISDFKNLIWISLTLSSVGLICMFGISYGFYRPVVGFTVMLLFEVTAFIISVIATNKMKETKTNNELFENAGTILMENFNKSLGTYSFTAFFAVLSVILLSLPLVIFTSDYVESVLSIESYFIYFLLPIALILIFIFIMAKKPYTAWITGQHHDNREIKAKSRVLLMNIIQLGMILIAGILFLIAPYFETPYIETDSSAYSTSTRLELIGGVLLACNIACFLIFMFKYRENRKKLLLPGIRNMLMISSAFLLCNVHYAVFTHHNEIMSSITTATADISYIWNFDYLWYSILLAVLIVVIFSIIEKIITKKENK